MKYLLEDPFRELERQTIFFAHPEELNDPIEDLQDIVWRGNRTLWCNLFRHYTYCLADTVLNRLRLGSDFSLKVYSIPITRYWDQPLTPEAKRIHSAAWNTVKKRCRLDTFAQRLAQSNLEARRDELIFLLTDIHDGCFNAIAEALRDPRLPGRPNLSECRTGALHHSSEWPSATGILGDQFVKEHEWREIRLRVLRDLSNDLAMEPGEVSRTPTALLTMDFPREYVDELKRLLRPKWYAACFTWNCNSIAMWSHYGENHTGACLVFHVQQHDTLMYLPMKTNERMWLSPCQRVSYQDRLAEVDFFEEVAHLDDRIRGFWYKDEYGTASKSMPTGETDGGQSPESQQRIWDRFMRLSSTKTPEWDHEQEVRLIMADTDTSRGRSEYRHNKWRTLQYQFCCLRGIVFGLRTTPDNIWKAVEIVNRKCLNNGRHEFRFLQAYYSHRTGDIRTREMPMLRR